MNGEGICESPFDYTFNFAGYPADYLKEFSEKLEGKYDWNMDDVRRLIWLYKSDCDAIMHLKAFGIHPVTGTKYVWGSDEHIDSQYNAVLKRNHANVKILRECWVKEMMMK